MCNSSKTQSLLTDSSVIWPIQGNEVIQVLKIHARRVISPKSNLFWPLIILY